MIRPHRPRVPGAGSSRTAACRIAACAAILALAGLVGCGDLAGLPPLDEPIAGDTVVTSQADLERLRGIRVIHGSLAITPPASETIQDLEPLSELEQVTGRLAISGVTGLGNLAGLSALRTVSSLHLRHNPDLESLAGATALTEIQSDFLVERNPKLTNLTGLSGLELVGRLELHGNEGLTSLDGVEETLARLSDWNLPSLHLEDNAQLTDLWAVADVQRWGRVFIRDNEILRDMSPLAGMVRVDMLELGGPALEIDAASFAQLDTCRSALLTDAPLVRSLEYLGTASVEYVVTYRAGLESVNGLSSVSDLRSVRLRENAHLTDLSDMAGIDSLQTFHLDDCDALTSLAALSGVRVGTVSIDACDELRDLQGLEGLTELEGSVFIQNNPLLESLRGLENLRSASTCWIRWNTSLCDTLVTDWMSGLDLEHEGDQRGNRECRRWRDGEEPPAHP